MTSTSPQEAGTPPASVVDAVKALASDKDTHVLPTLLLDLMAAAKAVEAALASREAELAESDQVRDRMAQLLTETAAALKGPPPPLTMHDWSDLPRVAASRGAEVRRLHDVISAAREEAKTGPPLGDVALILTSCTCDYTWSDPPAPHREWCNWTLATTALPARRLVAADPNDEAQVRKLGDAIRVPHGDWYDIARAALRAIAGEQAATATADCTGVAATWCPIHGDCACPGRVPGNDPRCPLHGDDSTHAYGLAEDGTA